MNKDNFKSAITPKEAIQLIKNNNKNTFSWFPVKGKGGCLFELGGNNYKGDLQLKVLVPYYDNKGKITNFYENGYLKPHFYIVHNEIIHPNDGFNFSLEEIEKIIQEMDLRKLKVKEEEIKVITTEIIKKLILPKI